MSPESTAESTAGSTEVRGVDPMPGGRRRIDRVLSPDFLTGMGDARWRTSAPVGTRPSRRRPTCRTCGDCCRAGSTSCAPSSRRRSGDERGSLVDQLAGILADGPAGEPHGMGRHATVEPSRVAESRRSVEQLVATWVSPTS